MSAQESPASDPQRRLRRFGPLERKIAIVGQGTYQMQRDPKAGVDALRHGIELGLEHVDTAELYGGGEVERLVGTAIRGARDRVFLVSKADPAKATRRGLVDACDASLRRLGTDRIDAYLLHWLPPHPLEDAVAAFDELVAAGKILGWGVSNFDEVKLAEMLALAGTGNVLCNQVMHHLGQRSIEHAVVPFCRDCSVAVVGYSPYGAGAFPPATNTSNSGAKVLAEVANAVGATQRQVALAFLAMRSGGFTIPKASRREHVDENAGANDVVLPAEALHLLDSAFPLGPHTGGVQTW